MKLTKLYQDITKVVIALLVIVGPLMLSAQNGATAPATDTSATYLSPMEYAFMMHEEPKFMLRTPLFGLGAEVMLLPGVTLMGQYIRWDFTYLGSRFEAELRYYLRPQSDRKKNMSGNYLALGAFKNQNGFGDRSNDSWHSQFAYVRFGMQRRFLGNGLIDLGLNAGLRQDFYPSVVQGQERVNMIMVNLVTKIGFGWVFKSRKDLDWSALCPVTKCYDAENWMFKLSTANLFSLNFNAMRYSFLLNPKIAVEYKLFESAFSINAGASSEVWMIGYDFRGKYIKSIGSFNEIYAEGRWYYNLNRRMIKGKTGNGLSANYVSGGWRYHEQRYDDEISFNPSFPFIATGIQRTLGDHFYFDVKMGRGLDPRVLTGSELPRYERYEEWIFDFQVGFKF